MENFIFEPTDSLKKYRTEIPNMVDDMGLSVYAFRLYFHLKRVVGANSGACWEGTRAIAAACKMSVGSVVAAKRELVEKGLIVVETRNAKNHETDIIKIVDIWETNFKHFAESNTSASKTTNVHTVNTPVHMVNSSINADSTINGSAISNLAENISKTTSVHDMNISKTTSVHTVNERKNHEEEEYKNKNIHVELKFDECEVSATGSLEAEAEPVKQKTSSSKKRRNSIVFNPMPEFREPIQEIFRFWQQTLNHPQSILTPERGNSIQDRLLQGYTVEQIQNAIKGCKASPYHMGENATRTIYDDLTLICRNGAYVEQFVGRYLACQPKKAQPANVNPNPNRPLTSLEKMALIDAERAKTK